jgi:hypothetical protein
VRLIASAIIYFNSAVLSRAAYEVAGFELIGDTEEHVFRKDDFL